MDKRCTYIKEVDGFSWRCWCPFAKWLSEKAQLEYADGRCINRLRQCEKTGKIVTWNKRCDCEEASGTRSGQ